MSEDLILAAARATLAAALPGCKDWSDDPAAIRPDKLGAFIVTLTRDSATPAAMGSMQEEVQLTVRAEFFMEYEAREPGRELATVKGRAMREALRTSSTIRPLVDFVLGSNLDVELASGDRRLARVLVGLSVLATI